MGTRTLNRLMPLILVVAGLMTVHPCAGADLSTGLQTLDQMRTHLTKAETQLAAVEARVVNESASVDKLAKELKAGRDPAEVARELRGTEQRVLHIEQQVVKITKNAQFIRAGLMKILDRARLHRDEAVQKAVKDELVRLDSLVQRIAVVKREIDSLRAAVARLWDELRSRGG